MATTSEAEERVLSCQSCGASIYKEHLDKGLAGYRAGKLLCHFCSRENKAAPSSPASPVATAAAAPESEGELPTISLVDELEPLEPPAARSGTGLSPAGSSMASTGAPIAREERRFSRPLNKTGAGATRCKTFHSKLSDDAVRHLDDLVNEWLEKNPDIEIKFATSTVGLWTGKHAEPNLILNVFY